LPCPATALRFNIEYFNTSKGIFSGVVRDLFLLPVHLGIRDMFGRAARAPRRVQIISHCLSYGRGIRQKAVGIRQRHKAEA
jgi:hypothetical protein